MGMLGEIFVLIVLGVYLVQTSPATYYIGPAVENGSCIVNGSITLSPCLGITQLDQILSSPESTSILLLLLPGRHTLTKDLSAFNVSELAIKPWNDSGRVQVWCRVPAHFTFVDINELNVSFVTFNACSLRCANGDSQQSTYNILACVFVNQGAQHSIVTTPKGQLTLSIRSCQFNSTIGAINSMLSSQPETHNIVIVDTQFYFNMRAFGYGNGGALLVRRVTLYIRGCHFFGNTASTGGAINSLESLVAIVGSTFQGNYAREKGGAIFSLNSHFEIYTSEFHNNSAGLGGAVHFDGVLDAAIRTFLYDFSIESTIFTFNNVGQDGGALYCKGITDGSKVKTDISMGHSDLNSAENDGGFAYLRRCEVSLREFNISRNQASLGGAIYARESVMTFGTPSPHNISHNTAESAGGALYLQKSVLKYWPGPPWNDGPVITFKQNAVTSTGGRGGAIFVVDGDCEEITSPDNQCFFEYGGLSIPTKMSFLFLDNRASKGSALFGGLLDRCITLLQLQFPTPIEIFTHMSYFQQRALAVTSEPLKVCLCADSKPNCSVTALNFTRMRGQSIAMSVASVDQGENPVPSIISASYLETLSAHLQRGERSQETADRCTDLKYHVFTENSTEEATLNLEPSGNPCRSSPLSLLSIHIAIEPCSVGFEQQGGTCVCDQRLTEHLGITAASCSIDDQSIVRRGSIWLSYDGGYLKVHSNCPLDYCLITAATISFASPDYQCAYNRGGTLCGACQGNHSATLGGSKCRGCASSYAFIWLTALLAVAGLALVALLLVGNITISAGTINGLIFYANVVSTSGLTGLPNCSIHPTLSVFIAWLNLDLGVETCFYPGMDTYQKTWLQFVFPLYIWLLVAAIIVASYYSSRAMRVFSRNNIAILATLFLLSYSKILKTIVTALSFTLVWRGAADDVSDQLVPYKVWTYDGNIEYLKGSHTALFVVAFLVLVLLFLPYTLLLLFGQCVRYMTVRRRSLLWIHSTAFISILDAYHAPYNRRHRYWTGLMLLTRCILFLVFATNSTEDAVRTNMFAVTIVIIGILVIKTRATKVYRSVHIDLLELFFLLNLVTLSATLYYLKGTSNNDVLCKVISASIGLSLVAFLGILVYHGILRIRRMKCYKHSFLKRHSQRQQQSNIAKLDSVNLNTKSPSTTTVDLRESLLESMQ